MVSVLLIAAVVGIVIYKCYNYMFYKPPNFPPGPPRIPYFGSYLFLILLNYRHIHKAIDKLCKYYNTNILGFYFGSTPSIVCNDAASVKEALFNRDLDGRPNLLLGHLKDPDFTPGGIFFIDGLYWRDQRRFSLRHLRDFGFGRRFEELETEIRDEMQLFIDLVKSGPMYPHEMHMMKDGNVLIPKIFHATTANTFLKVLCNERVLRKDQEALFKTSFETIQFVQYGDDYGNIFSLAPWTAKWFPKLTNYDKAREGALSLYYFMEKILQEQYASYDESHERNFLDLYFKEMKEAERLNVKTDFSFNQFIMICADFMLPSIVAIPITTCFLFQRLIMNPDVMAKIHKEIDEVVGRGRLPSLDDRINLSYTEATLREIMRLETLVPSGIPHRALNRTKLGGYDIEEGSFVVTGLQSSHLDETKYESPYEFRPERFLDENGKLCLKKDTSLPFGAGKRLCAGETFARNLLFLLSSALLQNFNIRIPDGHKLPALDERKTGIVISTPDFWIKFEPR